MSKSTGCRNEPSTSENDTMTMRMRFLFAALTLALAAGSCSREPRTELFNGRDLTGWVCVTDPEGVGDARDAFSVQNGNIRIAGSPFGYMRTEETYDDYRLHVEWRRTAAFSSACRPATGFGPRLSSVSCRRGARATCWGWAARRSPGRRATEGSSSSRAAAGSASGPQANGTVPRSSAWAIISRSVSTAFCRTSAPDRSAAGISRFRARAVPWSSATSG